MRQERRAPKYSGKKSTPNVRFEIQDAVAAEHGCKDLPGGDDPPSDFNRQKSQSKDPDDDVGDEEDQLLTMDNRDRKYTSVTTPSLLTIDNTVIAERDNNGLPGCVEADVGDEEDQHLTMDDGSRKNPLVIAPITSADISVDRASQLKRAVCI